MFATDQAGAVMNDVERCRAEFEENGETYVREQFDLGRFNPFKRGVALNWLNELDRMRSASSAAASAKLALDSARDAARSAAAAERQAAAAEEANDIARQANARATAAIIIAIIAAAVTIWDALFE